MSDESERNDENMTDEEYAYTFDAMHDVAERWDITLNDADEFLERAGYFDTERYHEIAEYFEPTDPSQVGGKNE